MERWDEEKRLPGGEIYSPEGVGQHVPAVEGVDGNSGIQLASVTAENGAPGTEHHVSLEEEESARVRRLKQWRCSDWIPIRFIPKSDFEGWLSTLLLVHFYTGSPQYGLWVWIATC